MGCLKEGCEAAPMASGWCWFHDPALKEERKLAQANGGSALKMPQIELVSKSYSDLGDIENGVVEAINLIREGKLPAKQAYMLIWSLQILLNIKRQRREEEEQIRWQKTRGY